MNFSDTESDFTDVDFDKEIAIASKQSKATAKHSSFDEWKILSFKFFHKEV